MRKGSIMGARVHSEVSGETITKGYRLGAHNQKNHSNDHKSVVFSTMRNMKRLNQGLDA
jgi:hypothetical protein